MTKESKNINLTANERTYICVLIKREIDAITTRPHPAVENIEQSIEQCKANLQHIYDMLNV